MAEVLSQFRNHFYKPFTKEGEGDTVDAGVVEPELTSVVNWKEYFEEFKNAFSAESELFLL